MGIVTNSTDKFKKCIDECIGALKHVMNASKHV